VTPGERGAARSSSRRTGLDSGDTIAQFGAGTDIPVVGDFNGDGLDEIGVFRNGSWYIDMNNNFQWNGATGGDAEWSFGQAGDIPVVSPSKWNCSW
jgi:serine-aspartate repeat-containing protein C/D/E